MLKRLGIFITAFALLWQTAAFASGDITYITADFTEQTGDATALFGWGYIGSAQTVKHGFENDGTDSFLALSSDGLKNGSPGGSYYLYNTFYPITGGGRMKFKIRFNEGKIKLTAGDQIVSSTLSHEGFSLVFDAGSGALTCCGETLDGQFETGSWYDVDISFDCGSHMLSVETCFGEKDIAFTEDRLLYISNITISNADKLPFSFDIKELELVNEMHLGDFDVDRTGLEVMKTNESDTAYANCSMFDARTGEVLWGEFAGRDTTRVLCDDLDPRYEGAEVYTNYKAFDQHGNMIDSEGGDNFAVYWDGDILREINDDVYVTKYMPYEGRTAELLNADTCVSNNGTKENCTIQADIFGDWREEIVLPSADGKYLKIYSTTCPTPYKLYTLMHDPIYRAAAEFDIQLRSEAGAEFRLSRNGNTSLLIKQEGGAIYAADGSEYVLLADGLSLTSGDGAIYRIYADMNFARGIYDIYIAEEGNIKAGLSGLHFASDKADGIDCVSLLCGAGSEAGIDDIDIHVYSGVYISSADNELRFADEPGLGSVSVIEAVKNESGELISLSIKDSAALSADESDGGREYYIFAAVLLTVATIAVGRIVNEITKQLDQLRQRISELEKRKN